MRTRQQLRQQTIRVKGKKVRTIHYLDKMAERLPKLKNIETGELFDHKTNLRGVFLHDGNEGVKKYLSLCNAIMKRDRGNFIQKYWNIVKLWILR